MRFDYIENVIQEFMEDMNNWEADLCECHKSNGVIVLVEHYHDYNDTKGTLNINVFNTMRDCAKYCFERLDEVDWWLGEDKIRNEYIKAIFESED